MEPSESKVKMVKFNNGEHYPMLGLGTWQATPHLNESDHNRIYEAIKSAIDIGYRHFDCASIYNNEESIGAAIAEKIKEGVIRREDIYVTSKLWNNKHDPKDVEEQLKKSLKLLGLKYLDLYLIHWPFATTDDPVDSEGLCKGANISYLDTWKAMEQCVHSGLTKSIGISNFNIEQVKDILKVAKIKPVVNQVENHPFLTQEELKEFCESNGILLTAYGPLGSPYRGTENNKLILDVFIIKQLAYKYDSTPAQILIRFQIQRGLIVIPKSTHPLRQKENFEVWDFELTPQEMHHIHSLNRNFRFVVFPSARHLKDYPFDKNEYSVQNIK